MQVVSRIPPKKPRDYYMVKLGVLVFVGTFLSLSAIAAAILWFINR